MTCRHEFYADILVLALAIRRRGRHHKASTTFFVQVAIEIRNPKVVTVADFFILVDGGQTKRQSPCTLTTFGLYLIHIKRRIRHHIIAQARQIMGIVIEGVCLVARLDNSSKAMHSHVHQAKLGIVFHLFLAVKSHGLVACHSGRIHKIASLHEHAATSASRVQKHTIRRFQHIHNHLHQ